MKREDNIQKLMQIITHQLKIVTYGIVFITS